MMRSPTYFPGTLAVLFLFIAQALPAQEFCGSSRAFSIALAQDSDMQSRHIRNEAGAYRYFRDASPEAMRAPFPYTLPVVVHIIHNNGPENLSDSEVQQGIQHLNEAFANVGYYDQNTGVNTEIQFCLAQRDPDGNATTGITRRTSGLTELTIETDDIAMKNLSRWEPRQYINIWLVREICSNASGCGVAGYAYLPAAHGSSRDGVVVEARWLDGSPANAAVLVHEMGHYLGLYHTFEGGCANGDCLQDGDRVCDTPPDQSTASVPCGATVNSCSTDALSGFATDQPDLFRNYMDYSDFSCYNSFTPGQTTRMGWHIENVRYSLLASPGCMPPCLSPISLSITNGDQSIPAGTTLNFNSNATNAGSYEWSIDGQPFGSGPAADQTFNQTGSFNILLTATNGAPNCLAADSIVIEVYCPVEPSFNTSNGYPLVGEAVSFTNTSSNAASWQWSVNDNVESTSADLSYTFNSTGVFTVCLDAGNGLCEQAFCQTLFVSEPEAGTGCTSTFIQSIGTPGGDEEGRRLIAEPGGGLLLGGSRGDSTLICLLGPGAGLVRARTFKFTGYPEFITDMVVDSDGFLVAVGSTELIGNIRRNFAFRYDYQNDILLWQGVFNYGNPDRSHFYQVLEIAPGGNFLVTGDTWNNNGPGLGCDALLMELGRNSGAALWAKNADLGSCETYNRILPLDNGYYAVGRYNFLPNQNNRMRAGMSRLDLAGEESWSRLYLVNLQTDARLYPTDILSDNGLVVAGYGDLQNNILSDASVFLYKTDLDGDVLWARRFDITGGDTHTAQRMLNLPDGYLICGSYQEGGQFNIFLLKTDKQGAYQWAKKYGGMADDRGWDIFYHNGLLHLVGATASLGGGGEILLARLDVDGNAPDGCAVAEPLAVQQADIINPYEGYHPLDIYSISTSFFGPSGSTPRPSHLVETPACPPVPCVDTCDIVADAFWGSLEATCKGDSLEYTLSICNQGSLPLPAGTPIAFYDSDPTATNAALLGLYFLPQDIEKDSCREFTARIAAPAGVPVFAMINNRGDTPPPFGLADGPGDTEIPECDYTNNLISYQLDYTPPPLNLGPDTVMCANGAVRLDAGPGFISYQWQDGSTERTYTTSAPGTYRVEAVDSCGGVHADSILITVEPATQVILPADTAVCPGSTLTYSLDGFDSYQWFPAAAVDCADCPAVNLTIDTSISIIVVAGTAIGCYSTDTVRIERIPAIYTTDTLLFCIGDTVTVFGQPASSPGDYEMAFTTANGCDSIHTITLAFFAPIEAGLTTTESCPGAENGQAMANPGGGLPPYQYFWSVPGENASTLDSLPPGSYQLTVTDANGCRAEVSFTIGEFDVFSVSLTPADASCFGEADGSLFIESEEAGLQFSLDGANYQPAPLFTGLEAGEYQLYILSANGCEGQASFRIGQPPEIILRLPQDTSVNLGDSLLLRAQAVPADSLLFSWSPEEGLSCADCLQPVASPLQTTVYQLIAEDNFGCSAEDGIEVRVNFEQKVYIPTAFSPNEDGRNDLFYLYGGAGVANILRLRVFGRWGELIYDEQNLAPNQPGRGWDGTFRGRKLNPGVFVYVAEVEFINGQVAVFKGEVNLVR